MVLSTRRLPSLLRGPGEPGSPALSGTTKALRLPIRASAVTYGFASAAHPIPPIFVFAAALLQGRRSLPGPGFVCAGRPNFRLLRVDANGISQVSRRSFPCLCCAPRPRSNRRVLAISATSMLPPLCAQRRLRQLHFGAPSRSFSTRCPTLRVSCCHSRARLASGWLAFAGRASNPLDRYERFQFVYPSIPLSCYPDANGLSPCETHRDGGRTADDGEKTPLL